MKKFVLILVAVCISASFADNIPRRGVNRRVEWYSATGNGSDTLPYVPSISTSSDTSAATKARQDSIIYNTGKGVPTSFSQQTSSARTFFIQKGQLNHYRQRPVIINEHVETARQVQDTVKSGKIVGQIFRASQDNINSFNLTLESAAYSVIDNFESYVSGAALQAVWVANNDLAVLSTAIVSPRGGSTQCMELEADNVANYWTATISQVDLTGYTADYDAYFTDKFDNVKLAMVLVDSLGNTKSFVVAQQDKNVWEHIEVNETAFTQDQTPDMDITKTVGLRFGIAKGKNGKTVYVDNLQQAPPPGTVSLELWDMGSVIPVDGVTALDDGTRYNELGDRGINSGTVSTNAELSLLGGKRLYHVRTLVAGVALEIPGNTTLTVDNYYAVIIKYIDTDVVVYGANTSYSVDYYTSGYAFTAPDTTTAITKLGTYNDLQFAVFSTQDCYVNTVLKFYDALPGSNATESVYIEDFTMAIKGVIASENQPQQSILVEFKDRPFFFPKGGKFEVNHNDDFSDDATQITVLIGYMFKPYPAHN